MKKSAILLFLFLVCFIFSFGQWTQQVSNTTSVLNDVFFLNDLAGFAVGDNGIFLKTLDGGQVWSITMIDPSKDLNAVTAVSSNTIFAGGNGLYKSMDGGSTWVTIDIDFAVLQLVFFSESIGFAKSSWVEECNSSQGQEIATRYYYLKTTDGGQNWVPSGFDNGQTAGAMEMVSPDVGYLGSNHEDFNGGIHCELQYHSLFYKTINGGLTWTEPLGWFYWPEFSQTSFFNDSAGYAVTTWAGPELEKTTDGGNSFSFISTLPQLPTFLAFANEYEGYFIKDNHIYKTTTGGCLWEVDHTINSSFKDIVITDNYMAYVVGENGTILHNDLDPVIHPDSIYSISCNTQQLDFPLTSVNGESIQNLTLKSSGSMEIMISITAPPDFMVKIQGDTVFSLEIDSLILQAQHDTLIEVAFQPSQAGNYSANLEIQSNASNDTTLLIPMTGTAIYALSGLITHDTLICQDTILLIGTTKVTEGARLTICPGTTFFFKGLYALEIYGSLQAIGEPGDSIIFTPENKTEGWNGIRIMGNGIDSTILKFCRIEYGNVAWDTYYWKGGGISIKNNNNVLISHCEISHCTANSAGGGIYIEAADPTVQYCELKYNYGHYDGGGICIKEAHPQIRNNNIHHNSSNYGGGISVISCSPSIINNTIYSNSAHSGGGIALDNEHNENPAPVMQNLIFNNNASYGGGGIYSYEAEPDFMNNTVCNNTAGTNGGGMMAQYAGQTFVEGNIFYGNAGGQVFLDAAYLMVSYCNIQGGWNGYGHENIDAEPAFLNPSANTGIIEDDAGIDWSFLASSPNYNKGIPDSTGQELPPYDFAGYPRIYDGRMDIGAFESHFYKQLMDTAVCTGDSFSLSVIPSGEGPFSFEWKHDDELIQEADSNVLLIESVSMEDAGFYRCHVTCPEGDFYSYRAGLSVETTTPLIIEQPEGGQVAEGESFTLSVSADYAVTYQWYLNDSLIEGATDRLLIILNFSAENQGSYRCYMENGCGGLFSDEAILLIDTTFIAENITSFVRVYPNPASWQLTIAPSLTPSPNWGRDGVGAIGGRQVAFAIIIADLFGRRLKELDKISSFPFFLDISDLNDGLYILRIIDDKGQTGSVKFLKISN